MKIKSTLKFHIACVRMVKVLKQGWILLLRIFNNKNTHSLLVGGKPCTTTMEIIVEILQKDGNQSPHDPDVPSWVYI